MKMLPLTDASSVVSGDPSESGFPLGTMPSSETLISLPRTTGGSF